MERKDGARGTAAIHAGEISRHRRLIHSDTASASPSSSIRMSVMYEPAGCGLASTRATFTVVVSAAPKASPKGCTTRTVGRCASPRRRPARTRRPRPAARRARAPEFPVRSRHPPLRTPLSVTARLLARAEINGHVSKWNAAVRSVHGGSRCLTLDMRVRLNDSSVASSVDLRTFPTTRATTEGPLRATFKAIARSGTSGFSETGGARWRRRFDVVRGCARCARCR